MPILLIKKLAVTLANSVGIRVTSPTSLTKRFAGMSDIARCRMLPSFCGAFRHLKSLEIVMPLGLLAIWVIVGKSRIPAVISTCDSDNRIRCIISSTI